MAEQLSLDRLQLIAEIARRYYADGLSQDEIAKLVGLSRPSISRLLLDARELGIVEIRVHPPIPTVPELEDRLARTFNLQEVSRPGVPRTAATMKSGANSAASP